jgi:hypothetical protein
MGVLKLVEVIKFEVSAIKKGAHLTMKRLLFLLQVKRLWHFVHAREYAIRVIVFRPLHLAH